MIIKFKTIKNLAVFRDFDWDTSVRDTKGQIFPFKQVNVIYGRNYSGKTTLSRMMRAFETGILSDKTGTETLTEKNCHDKSLLVRVFNDDFIRENLGFVINQTDTITPFAILGENNEKIEAQIHSILDELGSDSEGERTGLYLARENAQQKFNDAESKYKNALEALDKQKNKKATDREVGIKYKPERFGNQNYNIRALETDINTVLSDTYAPLNDVQVSQYEKYLTEKIWEHQKKSKLLN